MDSLPAAVGVSSQNNPRLISAVLFFLMMVFRCLLVFTALVCPST